MNRRDLTRMIGSSLAAFSRPPKSLSFWRAERKARQTRNNKYHL